MAKQSNTALNIHTPNTLTVPCLTNIGQRDGSLVLLLKTKGPSPFFRPTSAVGQGLASNASHAALRAGMSRFSVSHTEGTSMAP